MRRRDSKEGKHLEVLFPEARSQDEFLNGEIFYTLREAKVLIERWRREYNNVRPHSALNNIPPILYRTGGDFISDSSQPRELRF